MRGKAQGQWLEGSPRVVPYFPSLSTLGSLDEYDSEGSMFTQDVHGAVMPIGRSSGFTVTIEGDSDHTERTIAILGSLAQYDRHRQEELLSDAISGIAQRLLQEGVAVHEIVRDEENDGLYSLYSFTSQRLFRVFGKYFQVIPKTDREEWGKAYVVIPDKDIWKISIPSIFGGCRGYRATRKRLARISQRAPFFWQYDLSKQNQPAYFNPQAYRKEAETLVAKITVWWGWNQRDYDQKNVTRFYQYYRSLRLMWAQAILREHILRELNKLLRRTGIRAKIIMEGLPTPSEILAVQEEMLKGRISFGDAYNKCSV